jgi:hypothetical protein
MRNAIKTKTKGTKKSTKAKGTAQPVADPDLVPLTAIDKEAKAKQPKGKAKREAKPKAPKKDKPLSCLDAAAVVLKATGEPMACRAMIEAMREKKLWTSAAPTPHATLSSALLREITKKKDASRFKKVDRGQFALNA